MKFNLKRLFLIQNFFYGFGLKSKEKIIKFKFLLIHLIHLILFGLVIYDLVNDPADFEEELYELIYGYFVDTTISFVIYFNWILKYEKIMGIYNSLIDPIDDKFNNKIMKIGRIFSSLWFIVLPTGILCDLIGNLYLQKADFPKNEQSYQNIVLLFLNLLNYYYLIDGVIIYAILNYTFINLLIYLKFEHSIKCLFPKINENVTFQNNLIRCNLVKMNKMLTCHQQIRKQINESMGIFPFLTISGIFLNICLRMTLFVTNDIKTNYMIATSADFIVLIFFNLLMIVILSLIPNENNIFSEIILLLKKNANSMAFHPFDKEQNNLFIEKTILFKLVHCPCYAQHNAWEMFDISKSFILSFVAAVTTFSVMIIQIKQSIK